MFMFEEEIKKDYSLEELLPAHSQTITRRFIHKKTHKTLKQTAEPQEPQPILTTLMKKNQHSKNQEEKKTLQNIVKQLKQRQYEPQIVDLKDQPNKKKKKDIKTVTPGIKTNHLQKDKEKHYVKKQKKNIQEKPKTHIHKFIIKKKQQQKFKKHLQQLSQSEQQKLSNFIVSDQQNQDYREELRKITRYDPKQNKNIDFNDIQQSNYNRIMMEQQYSRLKGEQEDQIELMLIKKNNKIQ